MKHKPANQIQDLQFFGEFGGVNPSISDSSTYTFMNAKAMMDTFTGDQEGCYLYSRHSSPSTQYLSQALAKMENTASAQVFASGMGAISSTLMQLCKSGNHIVSSHTIYGGTYAFMKHFLPDFGVKTSFINITNLEEVEAAILPQTKVLYCETLSNPLLEVANLASLSKLAKKYNLTLVVDNTFTPLCISPANHGADIVIHSLTKFINGSSDAVGGAVCASTEFIESLKDVNHGAGMLLGQTLDSLRAASILKNLKTLPIRMEKHSANALYLAQYFQKIGVACTYPGLENNKGHHIFKSQGNSEFGFSGLFTLDLGTIEKATEFMERMQQANVGYLAVSLGYYKTLFTASGSSTSSEIPEEEQKEMGLSEGLVRFSIGLDHDIQRTAEKIEECLVDCGMLQKDENSVLQA
jgi:methionine-gamma-lyase